jgi:hypothetical protein
MKIIRHTETCLELGSQDSWLVKLTLSFAILLLAISFISFDTNIGLIITALILMIGAIKANFEMSCQFDYELNLFKLNYRNLIRQIKIERVLQDIEDVRLEQETDIDKDIFYYLVVIMKSGEEITIPPLMNTSPDIKTCEIILTEVKSFIHNRK